MMSENVPGSMSISPPPTNRRRSSGCILVKQYPIIAAPTPNIPQLAVMRFWVNWSGVVLIRSMEGL